MYNTFLDPKSDLVFKRIFCQEKDLLISLLNALLPDKYTEDEIVDLEYLPTEQVPIIPDLKNSIVDVKCISNKGTIFIVEMQMLWSDAFTHRMLFNASKAYINQIPSGADYQTLKPVIALGILDGVYDKKTDEYYHYYEIINRLNTEEVIEGIEIVLIELPKFKPTTYSQKRLRVKWLRFLNEIKTMNQLPPEFSNEEVIVKAAEISRTAAYTPAQLEGYDKYYDYVSRERTRDGLAKMVGREEGRKEGIEQGIEQGINLGVLKALKLMIESGMSESDAKEILKIK